MTSLERLCVSDMQLSDADSDDFSQSLIPWNRSIIDWDFSNNPNLSASACFNIAKSFVSAASAVQTMSFANCGIEDPEALVHVLQTLRMLSYVTQLDFGGNPCMHTLLQHPPCLDAIRELEDVLHRNGKLLYPYATVINHVTLFDPLKDLGNQKKGEDSKSGAGGETALRDTSILAAALAAAPEPASPPLTSPTQHAPSPGRKRSSFLGSTHTQAGVHSSNGAERRTSMRRRQTPPSSPGSGDATLTTSNTAASAAAAGIVKPTTTTTIQRRLSLLTAADTSSSKAAQQAVSRNETTPKRTPVAAVEPLELTQHQPPAQPSPTSATSLEAPLLSPVVPAVQRRLEEDSTLELSAATTQLRTATNREPSAGRSRTPTRQASVSASSIQRSRTPPAAAHHREVNDGYEEWRRVKELYNHYIRPSTPNRSTSQSTSIRQLALQQPKYVLGKMISKDSGRVSSSFRESTNMFKSVREPNPAERRRVLQQMGVHSVSDESGGASPGRLHGVSTSYVGQKIIVTDPHADPRHLQAICVIDGGDVTYLDNDPREIAYAAKKAASTGRPSAIFRSNTPRECRWGTGPRNEVNRVPQAPPLGSYDVPSYFDEVTRRAQNRTRVVTSTGKQLFGTTGSNRSFFEQQLKPQTSFIPGPG
eukprot:CAMPEP_0176423190 /NCGR_PEP_ID=MMETSP0127-20121128/10144_1 /TAXON_ID=938130 /ORGANISM="Platyophrya macrostoma, Strain WH" /LENGTH=647 /DNA_ID=CAMNT_0017804109 /DNA_START=16 /DNA_END=1956 /DNA_ORIENTATION=+